MDLKVLVWDGSFGADVQEMRMPLPDLYPSSTTPYDQNEDVAARTLGEAIVSRFLSCRALHTTHPPTWSIPFLGPTEPCCVSFSTVEGFWFLPDQPNFFVSAQTAALCPPRWRRTNVGGISVSPDLTTCLAFIMLSPG